jgi:YD repeat-containing protein
MPLSKKPRPPLGPETVYGYDALSRQTSVTDPLGNVTSYGYDAASNRISMTDANSVTTRYEYDGLVRLRAVVENYVDSGGSDGQTNVRTEYTYDAAGNRTAIRDANGHVTSFDYDAVNRLVQETDPLGHATHYAYDAAGNRTELMDANGFTTAFEFDKANRLTFIDYPEFDADVTFSYDSAGNRLSMEDGTGQTIWEYDALNRPTSITSGMGETVG